MTENSWWKKTITSTILVGLANLKLETVLPPSISRKWKMGFSPKWVISFILWAIFKIEPCFRRNGNHQFFSHTEFPSVVFRVYHFCLFRMWSVGWKDLKDLNANYVTVPWVTHDLPSFFRGYGAPYIGGFKTFIFRVFFGGVQGYGMFNMYLYICFSWSMVRNGGSVFLSPHLLIVDV